MASRENLNPQALGKIARELQKLVSEPPLNGVTLIVNEQDFSDIQATIEGPAATPYEGGLFRCKLIIGSEFPSAPPRGLFLTKIFHPNVSSSGDICVNTLKKDWSPELGIMHVLQVIRCLLIVPFPESALNEEASRLFLESYDEYFRRAKLMTSIHAMKNRGKSSEDGSAPAAMANSQGDDDVTTSEESRSENPVKGDSSNSSSSDIAASAKTSAVKALSQKKSSSSGRSALKRL